MFMGLGMCKTSIYTFLGTRLECVFFNQIIATIVRSVNAAAGVVRQVSAYSVYLDSIKFILNTGQHFATIV